jgi:Transcriptional regulator, AbiEi antitoxin, Type IV TA system
VKREVTEIRRGIQEAIPSAMVEVTPWRGGRATADFAVSVDLKGIHLGLVGEWVNNPSGAILRSRVDQLQRASGAEPGVMPLIMASYLTDSQRSLLTDAGVAFIDLDGDAHIEGEGIYTSRVSPKASRPRKVALRDAKSLLQDWAAAYDHTRSATTGYFCRARSAVEIIDKIKAASIQTEYALTAQAGAHLVAPYAAFDRVDVYPAGPSATAELVAGLTLEPVEKGANVFVWNPYYRYSVFFGSREVAGVRVVSDIQLYLDLFKYPLRGREQAQHLYETVLKSVVERDA